MLTEHKIVSFEEIKYTLLMGEFTKAQLEQLKGQVVAALLQQKK